MPGLHELVAAVTQGPITGRTEGQVEMTNNSKRNAYEAGKRAAQQAGMTEVELILFIEGFRAGLLEKVIEG